ncbi:MULTISPECIES: hypothetical protein, partial [unclassified Bartonella]|uniref:hypothetical protein n=1 Tax=unclassified Bartonella TaxID=2645622 RepID=UPI0035D09435
PLYSKLIKVIGLHVIKGCVGGLCINEKYLKKSLKCLLWTLSKVNGCCNMKDKWYDDAQLLLL